MVAVEAPAPLDRGQFSFGWMFPANDRLQLSGRYGLPAKPIWSIGQILNKRVNMQSMIATGAGGWLDWYSRMGVTDCVEAAPTNKYRAAEPAEPNDLRGPAPVPRVLHAQQSATRKLSRPASADQRLARTATAPSPLVASAGADTARQAAQACASIAELKRCVDGFDGCALRDTATSTCFSDGNPEAQIMFVGEAPGAQEDRQGKPFVGPSGKLLDRMLACVGWSRRDVYITNVIFWRPPGNRKPTPLEIAICQPFLERQIELIRPRLLVFVGSTAAQALLGLKDGVTRLRGRRLSYAHPGLPQAISASVIFHPAYLLRQPLNKRLAWIDLLALREEFDRLSEERPA